LSLLGCCAHPAAGHTLGVFHLRFSPSIFCTSMLNLPALPNPPQKIHTYKNLYKFFAFLAEVGKK
jgi:hypothetical protein